MAKSLGISEVLSDMFRSPLNAVVEAERNYLAIWADWLEMQLKLIGDDDLTQEQIEALMTKAPAVKLDGFIDVGVSMRIATVKQKDVSFGVGIGVGPVHASGAFGFSKTSSQESMFQASARFNITNHNTDLSAFLAERGKTPYTIQDVHDVTDLMRKWSMKDFIPETND